MEAFTAFATTTGACAYVASAPHTGRDFAADRISPPEDRPVAARQAPEQGPPEPMPRRPLSA